MMKAFTALLLAGIKMLGRNRVLLISSLGLALISIFVFGWLFGGNGTPTLQMGVVDQDGSAAAGQVVAALQGTRSLTITTGTPDAELQALRDGHRSAVLVLPAGFGAELAQGHAALQVYYDESNPTTQAYARMAVQSVVTSVNEQITGRASPVTLSEQAVSVRNLRQIDWLTPGMLGMLLMWANLSIGVLLVQWREQGIMRRLAATPLRPGVLMVSQMLARLALSVAQGAVLIAVAILVFKVQIVGSWWALLAVVSVGALTMMALGFVAGSFARTSEAAQAVTFLVSFPMMFLGGSYFPTDSAPTFLAPVVKAMPLSYLNDALRQIVNNGANFAGISTDLMVLAAWAVAALLVSARAFRWS
jgi:ABC-2 type transport system permease protein